MASIVTATCEAEHVQGLAAIDMTRAILKSGGTRPNEDQEAIAVSPCYGCYAGKHHDWWNDESRAAKVLADMRQERFRRHQSYYWVGPRIDTSAES